MLRVIDLSLIYHPQCYIFLTNLESFDSFNKFNIFYIPLFYFSVTINESKEKFRIVLCCFSAIKNIIVALSYSSNFPRKLIC